MVVRGEGVPRETQLRSRFAYDRIGRAVFLALPSPNIECTRNGLRAAIAAVADPDCVVTACIADDPECGRWDDLLRGAGFESAVRYHQYECVFANRRTLSPKFAVHGLSEIDFPAIASVWSAAYRHERDWYAPSQCEDFLAWAWARRCDYPWLGITLRGRLSGFILTSASPQLGEPATSIVEVAVLPAVRRHGLGASLVSAAMARAQHGGVRYGHAVIADANTASIDLFQWFGFVRVTGATLHYRRLDIKGDKHFAMSRPVVRQP